jgi:hypothetical protein
MGLPAFRWKPIAESSSKKKAGINSDPAFHGSIQSADDLLDSNTPIINVARDQ